MKRYLDIIFAASGLVVLFPVMLVIAALVKLSLGSPVFFRQERAGYKGRSFMLVKFRTMSTDSGDADDNGDDEKRLTKFGLCLRASSLDELPELWNVLRGEMSIVGPRPLLTHYLHLYSDEQMRRHDVRPGVTGWAQVNGRNGLSWEDRFELDTWYVDNRSLWLDLKICLVTVIRVIRRDGISSTGMATMPRFEGSTKK